MALVPFALEGLGCGVTTTTIDDLLRPLSARSVIASALLGTRPPRLQGRLLVALAEEFEIAAGTARVALSRMVDRGELVNDDGHYALSGNLLRRQVRQDLGRARVRADWDLTWEQAIVTETGRSAAERHALRRDLIGARLGELREGVWLRPANLERPTSGLIDDEVAHHVLWFKVAVAAGGDAAELVHRVFDTDGWATTAAVLLDSMHTSPSGISSQFRVAAAVLQHLTRDPLLPRDLYPDGWPSDELRDQYSRYEAELQAELRSFFAGIAA